MPWIPIVIVACALVAIAIAAVLAATVPALARFEQGVRWAMKGGQAVVALFVLYDVITLLQGHQADEGMTHAGYAIASVGVPVLLLTRQPGAPDPDDAEGKPVPADPPHLLVVAVAALATAVLVIRLQQTW